jgi:hypothetical protein
MKSILKNLTLKYPGLIYPSSWNCPAKLKTNVCSLTWLLHVTSVLLVTKWGEREYAPNIRRYCFKQPNKPKLQVIVCIHSVSYSFIVNMKKNTIWSDISATLLKKWSPRKNMVARWWQIILRNKNCHNSSVGKPRVFQNEKWRMSKSGALINHICFSDISVIS